MDETDLTFKASIAQESDIKVLEKKGNEQTQARITFMASQLFVTSLKAQGLEQHIKNSGISEHPQKNYLANIKGQQVGMYNSLLVLETATAIEDPMNARKLSSLRDLARYDLITDPDKKDLTVAQKKAKLVQVAEGIILTPAQIKKTVEVLKDKQKQITDLLKSDDSMPAVEKAKLQGTLESYGSVLYLLQEQETISGKAVTEAKLPADNIKDLQSQLSQWVIGLKTEIMDTLHSGIRKDELEKVIAFYEQDFQNMYAAKDTLPGSEQVLTEYRQDIQTAIKRYREEQERLLREPRGKDLKEIIRGYNVFMLHAINPDLVGGLQNEMIRKDVSWQNKLDIVLAIAPTIASSTFTEGDSIDNAFGPIGVIINDGAIPDARAEDTASVTLDNKERKTTPNYRTIDEKIDQAINLRNSNGYNELFVNDPKVSGFFMFAENRNWPEMPTDEELHQVLDKLKLPLFVIKEGEIFSSEYDQQNKKWNTLLEMTPAQMLNINYQLPPEIKDQVEQNAKLQLKS